MTGWQFPHNESKEEEGLADAGIETFKDVLQSWPLAAGFLDYLHGNTQQTGCESVDKDQ